MLDPSSEADPEAATADLGGISVISTVRNDREGTAEMLRAVEAQTRRPDEVVVVDGGSSDGTLELLEGWSRETLPLKVLCAPGTNISAGETWESPLPRMSGSPARMAAAGRFRPGSRRSSRPAVAEPIC